MYYLQTFSVHILLQKNKTSTKNFHMHDADILFGGIYDADRGAAQVHRRMQLDRSTYKMFMYLVAQAVCRFVKSGTSGKLSSKCTDRFSYNMSTKLIMPSYGDFTCGKPAPLLNIYKLIWIKSAKHFDSQRKNTFDKQRNYSDIYPFAHLLDRSLQKKNIDKFTDIYKTKLHLRKFELGEN